MSAQNGLRLDADGGDLVHLATFSYTLRRGTLQEVLDGCQNGGLMEQRLDGTCDDGAVEMSFPIASLAASTLWKLVYSYLLLR